MRDDVDMRRGFMSSLLLLAATVALTDAVSSDEQARRAPRFPSSSPAGWIGTPVTWEALRGRVVMLDVWTFG